MHDDSYEEGAGARSLYAKLGTTEDEELRAPLLTSNSGGWWLVTGGWWLVAAGVVLFFILCALHSHSHTS